MHLRQYEIVTDVDKLKVDLQATFMKYRTIKQWAYIVHDKDDTRPHYHIYLNFGTGVDSKLVADWFKLGYTDENGVEHTGEQFIEKVKGRKADILMYLTHENESQKYKHVYDRSEVVSNFAVDVEIEQAKIIGDFEHYSYAQQLKYIDSLPRDEKVKLHKKLKNLWELYLETSTLCPDRNIEVVFISGKGGAGKTYYAKKMLESMGMDYCVSSSSNDPFQDYMGQDAIILDDLRDVVFKDSTKSDGYEDLLKLLDNNTSSTVKSRFKNKLFFGKVIVITSTVPLWYWFSAKRSEYDGVDKLNQLYRRIGTYVVVEETLVTVYPNGVGEDGRPKGVGVKYVNELKNKKEDKKHNTDFISVFDKMAVREPEQLTFFPLLENELPFKNDD